MNKIIAVLFSGLFISQLVIADTRIVIKTSDGDITTWSNDKYTRLKLPSNEKMNRSPIQFSGMISDFGSGKSYFISDKQKLLIDIMVKSPMGGGFAGMYDEPKAEKLKVAYKNKTSAKKIAGLKTTKYDFMVNGKKCFEVWLTKDAAFAAEMKKHDLLDTSNSGDVEGGICAQADNQDNKKLDAEYGYAVKSNNADGTANLLLTEFKTNVTAPKKYLSMPAGYKIMTMMEAMVSAMGRKATQ